MRGDGAFHRTRRYDANLVFDQAIFLVRFNLGVKRATCDTQMFCRTRFVSTESIQVGQNQMAFDVV